MYVYIYRENRTKKKKVLDTWCVLRVKFPLDTGQAGIIIHDIKVPFVFVYVYMNTYIHA